ncbi:MAG: tRNA (guanosine(37)-N1)-methyltransferase TrmD, partial [Lachnospiraceae bacterium]|nr:tRNA (guanosine(37)-N1)-methyltransferase TrmD [Lachnospiraceae bacterium]
MEFHVMTLFPEMIVQGLSTSVLGRAMERGILSLNAVNIRDYTLDKHKRVDDYPYGGGAGMVMAAEPVVRCCRAVFEQIEEKKRGCRVYTSPSP